MESVYSISLPTPWKVKSRVYGNFNFPEGKILMIRAPTKTHIAVDLKTHFLATACSTLGLNF
jgi:hypothetical protein